MKKSKLVIDFVYDFDLAGITTPVKGYKLAWAINRVTGFHLVRMPDLTVGFKPMVEKYFMYYAYETRLNRLKLFRNRALDETGTRFLLVPEFPQFDFILLTRSDDPGFTASVTELIRSLPFVELVKPLDVRQLKSKVNFVM
ncbi:MAG: IPExxxVDY family protein [Cyclobacteriaceae bacterium]|nr:IPExxxVDY family protein [Cyclobacteriaceae bacterium]MDW8332209.1 IPExxxVDY family protein [Cyclobacteriaceae bacterium]